MYHRMHMRGDDYGCLCTTFALGVIVGFIGSEKIRFISKMHKGMHKRYVHNCCGSDHQTTAKEEPELS